MPVLEALPCLTAIKLSYVCKEEDAGVRVVIAVLKTLVGLKHLSLGYITPSCFNPVAAVNRLKSSLCQLTALEVLSFEGESLCRLEPAQRFFGCLFDLQSLTQLTFRANILEGCEDSCTFTRGQV